MDTLAAVLLKTLIAAGFIASLLGQVVILPWFIRDVVAQFPEVSDLALPYGALVVLGIVGAQVSLATGWILCSNYSRSRFVSRRSLRCLQSILWSIALAGAAVLVLGAHLLLVRGLGGPGVVLATLFCLGAAGALWLITFIGYRALLQQIRRDAPGLYIHGSPQSRTGTQTA